MLIVSLAEYQIANSTQYMKKHNHCKGVAVLAHFETRDLPIWREKPKPRWGNKFSVKVNADTN